MMKLKFKFEQGQIIRGKQKDGIDTTTTPADASRRLIEYCIANDQVFDVISRWVSESDFMEALTQKIRADARYQTSTRSAREFFSGVDAIEGYIREYFDRWGSRTSLKKSEEASSLFSRLVHLDLASRGLALTPGQVLFRAPSLSTDRLSLQDIRKACRLAELRGSYSPTPKTTPTNPSAVVPPEEFVADLKKGLEEFVKTVTYSESADQAFTNGIGAIAFALGNPSVGGAREAHDMFRTTWNFFLEQEAFDEVAAGQSDKNNVTNHLRAFKAALKNAEAQGIIESVELDPKKARVNVIHFYPPEGRKLPTVVYVERHHTTDRASVDEPRTFTLEAGPHSSTVKQADAFEVATVTRDIVDTCVKLVDRATWLPLVRRTATELNSRCVVIRTVTKQEIEDAAAAASVLVDRRADGTLQFEFVPNEDYKADLISGVGSTGVTHLGDGRFATTSPGLVLAYKNFIGGADFPFPKGLGDVVREKEYRFWPNLSLALSSSEEGLPLTKEATMSVSVGDGHDVKTADLRTTLGRLGSITKLPTDSIRVDFGVESLERLRGMTTRLVSVLKLVHGDKNGLEAPDRDLSADELEEISRLASRGKEAVMDNLASHLAIVGLAIAPVVIPRVSRLPGAATIIRDTSSTTRGPDAAMNALRITLSIGAAINLGNSWAEFTEYVIALEPEIKKHARSKISEVGTSELVSSYEGT